MTYFLSREKDLFSKSEYNLFENYSKPLKTKQEKAKYRDIFIISSVLYVIYFSIIYVLDSIFGKKLSYKPKKKYKYVYFLVVIISLLFSIMIAIIDSPNIACIVQPTILIFIFVIIILIASHRSEYIDDYFSNIIMTGIYSYVVLSFVFLYILDKIM